jgi:hypothetical protein
MKGIVILNIILLITLLGLIGAFVAIYFWQRSRQQNRTMCFKDAQCNYGKCKDNICVCEPGFVGQFCDVSQANVQDSFYAADCNIVPIACKDNTDCAVCANESAKCQEMTASNNPRNLEGKFCLDTGKPTINCEEECGGNWEWSGWTDIEGMGWRCRADFPNIFPEGNCSSQSSNICQRIYYNGGIPSGNLTCDCKQACLNDDKDCQVIGAKCENKSCKVKTGWNATRDGPICVVDNCPDYQTWVPDKINAATNPFAINGQCKKTTSI